MITGLPLQRTPRKRISAFGLVIMFSIFAAFTYFNSPEFTRTPAENTQLKLVKLAVAILDYKSHCGNFPADQLGMKALIEKQDSCENWKGPYFKDSLEDHWKKAFQYKTVGKNSVVSSLGADGAIGGVGDDYDFAIRIMEDGSLEKDFAP